MIDFSQQEYLTQAKQKFEEARAKGSTYVEALITEFKQNSSLPLGLQEEIMCLVEKAKGIEEVKRNQKLYTTAEQVDFLRGQKGFDEKENEKGAQTEKLYKDFWAAHHDFLESQQKYTHNLKQVPELMVASKALPDNLHSNLAINDEEIRQQAHWWQIGHKAYEAAKLQENYAIEHIPKINERLNEKDLDDQENKILVKRKTGLENDLKQAGKIKQGFEKHIEERDKQASLLKEMLPHIYKKEEYKEYYFNECKKFTALYGQSHEEILGEKEKKFHGILSNDNSKPPMRNVLRENCDNKSDSTHHIGGAKVIKNNDKSR